MFSKPLDPTPLFPFSLRRTTDLNRAAAMARSAAYIPVSSEMSNFFSNTPIFKTRESTLTFSLITLEAVLVCFLEGFVVYNHLSLVDNCNLSAAASGK